MEMFGGRAMEKHKKEPELSPADRLLVKLIQFDTTTGINPEKPAIDYVREALEAEGIKTRTYAKSEERPNLLAVIKGESEENFTEIKHTSGSGERLPALLLYGHMDVVPVSGQDWHEEPFSGVIKDGYIWGRGSLDMKGELAMFITAMLEIKRREIQLPFDVKLLIVSDEEGTGQYGMGYLVFEHPEIFGDVKYALGEIGGFSTYLSGKKLYPVMIAEKQFAHIKITARGEGGHGSFAHKNTAMERLSEAIVKLSRNPLPVRITPSAEYMIRAIAQAVGGMAGMALKLLLRPSMTDRLLGLLGEQLAIFKPILHNNINVTMIEGGQAVNVIPSAVSCQCDLRLVPGCTMEEALEDVRSIIGNGFEIEVIEYDKGSAAVDMTLVSELFAALKRKDGEALPVPLVVTGVTDGRFLSDVDIQTYGFTPMELGEDLDFTGLIHAADERIPVGAVDFGREVIVDFICRGYQVAVEDGKGTYYNGK